MSIIIIIIIIGDNYVLISYEEEVHVYLVYEFVPALVFKHFFKSYKLYFCFFFCNSCKKLWFDLHEVICSSVREFKIVNCSYGWKLQ